MSFSKDVATWAKKANGKVDARTRAIITALFSSIITSTPVDTGRARGNWQTSVSTPITGTTEREDPSGASAIAEVVSKQGGAGKVTFLTNNLPYIQVLEYGGYPDPVEKGTYVKGEGFEIRSEGGFSKQAPNGMVRVNMARIGAILRNAK